MDFLAANPDLMRGRELTRANYFARADARNAQQRQILERYLLDPKLGSAELERFADLYPNANYMVSNNLLTRSTPPNGANLVARDAASLAVLDDWLGDSRFERLRPDLEKTRERLAMFVRQASANR